MDCLDCPLKYMRQRGRTFYAKYKEHIHAITSNNGNSGCSNHILNTYGSITDTMNVIKKREKEKMFEQIREEPYIYN
jgi:hypothetical protein